MSRTKSKALRIVHSGAVSYQNNLANKNLLFVSINNELFVPVLLEYVDNDNLVYKLSYTGYSSQPKSHISIRVDKTGLTDAIIEKDRLMVLSVV